MMCLNKYFNNNNPTHIHIYIYIYIYIYFVDITIPYDSITNMESAANRKIEKYRHLGYVIPFCVGSLGSWYSGNQILKTEMNFPTNTWKILKTASIKESIEGSGRILSKFFNCF